MPSPTSVAEPLKTVLPDLVEVILIDTPLGEKVPVDIGAGGDASIDEDRRDIHSCAAEVPDIPDFLLVAAEIAFATKGDIHRTAFLPFPTDEIH